MLDRKKLKKEGKAAYYRNWKSCIIISLIYAFLVGGTLISFNIKTDLDYRDNIINLRNGLSSETNSDIVNEFLHEIKNEKPKEEPSFITSATNGAIATIVNNVSKSGSFIFGLLNAMNQFLFKDRIWASIIIIIGAILSCLYWIFVSKVLEVGQARFYLESRKYTETKASKILLPFKIKKTLHTAYTMFLKNLYTILWLFTIIGPIIKYYSYLMVPFILAENPQMSAKDVLKLSEEMMKGHKWEVFKMDLSFIGWNILGLMTFNVSNIIFTNAYHKATHAEVYMALRDLAKTTGVMNASELKDTNLEGDIEFCEYPSYEYMLRSFRSSKLFQLNYNRKYSVTTLILLFFVFAIAGYVWEVSLHLFRYGSLVNRGALYGPWLPIYGFGVVAILVLLKPFRQNPFLYFVLTMVLCGIIEYGTSVYLEVVHHMSWWNYNGFFLNLNGRICLEALLLFGVGGLAATYVAAPLIANFIDRLEKKVKIFTSVILVMIIAFDFYISGQEPNTGEGVTTPVASSLRIGK